MLKSSQLTAFGAPKQVGSVRLGIIQFDHLLFPPQGDGLEATPHKQMRNFLALKAKIIHTE